MGLSIVRARLCSEAHQTALRRFVCCDGGPEWAMDAQRYIRGLNIRRHADDSEIMLIVVEGATAYADTVLGFLTLFVQQLHQLLLVAAPVQLLNLLDAHP